MEENKLLSQSLRKPVSVVVSPLTFLGGSAIREWGKVGVPEIPEVRPQV